MNKKNFLILAVMLTLLSQLASANTSTPDATSNAGKTVVWTFVTNADGATIIQGNIGTAAGVPIDGDVIIPETVTDNGTGTTYSVTAIGGNVTDPNGVNGDTDFYTNWQGITSVTFPASLKRIENYTFSNANSMTSVMFKNPLGWASLTNIGYYAFNTLTVEKKLVITDLDLSGLVDPIIPLYMFRDRAGITGKLTLPTTTTQILDAAFSEIPFTSANLDELTELTIIERFAFYNNSFTITDLSNCTKLTQIVDNAFNKSAKNVNPILPSTLKLPIPSGELIIGNAVFNNNNLTGDLVVPAGITHFGNNAFGGNPLLRSIAFMADKVLGLKTPITFGISVFVGDNSLEYIDLSQMSWGTEPTTYNRNDANSPFYHTPTHTLVWTPHASTPSLIAASGYPNYMYDSSSDGYGNQWKSDWVSVADGVNFFIPIPFTATKCTYDQYTNNSYVIPTTRRTFTAGKASSIYLPYAVTMNNTSNVGVYTLSYYNQHGTGVEDNTFVFKKTTSLAAYTPYIARVDGTTGTMQIPDQEPANGIAMKPTPTGSGTIHDIPGYQGQGFTPIPDIFNDTRIQTSFDPQNPQPAGKLPAVIDDANPGVIWTLSGTTETIDNATAAAKGAYQFYSDGNWYPLNENAVDIAPLRVLLIPSVPGVVPSAKMFGGFIDETTGVGQVTSNSEQITNNIYTISGQYAGKDFNSLPKGIYIINGKKIMK